MSSTDPSSHAGDTSAPSSPVSAPSQAPPGPPTHDTFVRPFTSHGGPTYPPPSASAYYPPNPYPSERPFTSHGTASPFPPPAFPGGPYLSASARTSFTRVDVDSVGGIGGVGMYPVLPMPSIPTGLSTRNADDHADAMATPLDAEANAASNVDPGDIAGSGTEGMESQVPQTPQVSLTFLLVSGRRRTMSFEPQITVGRVKELVWNAWPGDWQDERPPAPSYLRILYLGKILQDEDTLARKFIS
ncbi:hypothetical protein BV22DRAFT_847681 [Leucogyrophana mollusca]|uniref:Uncharacterized protein n=1 Tax=Leucogyrophana mollusca TaxID=85980 RepID=A0ACB8B299_9AGAM|nr:hypothetical protein BV22DRAFT_847681 [Leucogyrophana mollusca]